MTSLEHLGPELGQQFLHARGLQLEHAGGVAPGKQLVGGLVLQVDVLDGELGVVVVAHHLHGQGDDRECLEPQKVELDKPGLFHALHVELGDVFIARAPVQRHHLVQGARRR